MKFGQVIGSVVCTKKDPSFDGVRLLLVQPMDDSLKAVGEPIVACDSVRAGTGDIIVFEGGREAALALENWFNPSDATVMGIIDSVDKEREQ